GEDHLIAVEHASVHQLDAAGASARDDDPAHVAVGAQGEVRARARRLEVGDVRRDPRTSHPVHRDGADAGRARLVVVVTALEAHALATGDEAGLHGVPFVFGPARDRDRPVVAVPGTITELEIALDGVQAREEVVPAPTGGPLLDVLGFGPERDPAVRRRRPAHATAAPVVEHPTAGGLD